MKAADLARLGGGLTIGRFTLRAGIETGHLWIEDAESGDGGDFPIADVEALLAAIPDDASPELAAAAVGDLFRRRF